MMIVLDIRTKIGIYSLKSKSCIFLTMLLTCSMVKIMGILNLTPDSFFEPSRHNYKILDSGADIIDIGAVSTRPGAADVTMEEEWARLEPVLTRLSQTGSREISVDTTRAEIVRRTYSVIGNFIVNDISAGEDDPEMLETVGSLGLPYIAMHKRGNPRTMDGLNTYTDIVEDLISYFDAFSEKAEKAGIKDWILDPGFGFAKDREQNLTLLRNLERFKIFGRPILIGIADKRFTEGRTEDYHLEGLQHGADILRVHDVEKAKETIRKFKES